MNVPAPDLRILLFEVTQKCNAACEQCGSRCDASGEERLKKEDIVSVFRDVKAHFGTSVMLNVTGGEPLLRKDLFEIMAEAHRLGFDWGMVTNGTLITDEVIEKMKATGMKTITVSIDGMKETHEALRKLPGSFDRILTALSKLKAADFLDCVQVTFTSNKKNVREFPALYETLKAVGIDSVRTSSIDPIGRAKEHPELMLSREDYEFLFDFIEKANREGSLPIQWGCCHFLPGRIRDRKFLCFAGIYAASILYNGDIFVCPNVPREPDLIQGNILKDRFSDVWKNGFRYYRNRPLPKRCLDCRYRDDCRGDSLHSFDFETGEPNFCFRALFESKNDYLSELKARFGAYHVTAVNADGPAPNVYLEPAAYEELRRYFHFGHRHPLSMYEQQMGLVGFYTEDGYVIRYVFPSVVDAKADDHAIFTKETVVQADRETGIIRANVRKSEDKDLFTGSGLRFLGFAHSHPAQTELQYSVGDEKIHEMLVKRYGDYLGMLVNPLTEEIGVYYGPEILQANLKIIEQA